jgi:hypothetical protein
MVSDFHLANGFRAGMRRSALDARELKQVNHNGARARVFKNIALFIIK